MPLFGKLNRAAFDRWSLVHIATGFVAGRAKLITLPQWVVLHTAAEILENTKRGIGIIDKASRKLGWQSYEGDSLTNVAGDTASTIAGFLYGIR